MGLLNNILNAAAAAAGVAVGATSAAIEIAAENIGNKISEVKKIWKNTKIRDVLRMHQQPHVLIFLTVSMN